MDTTSAAMSTPSAANFGDLSGKLFDWSERVIVVSGRSLVVTYPDETKEIEVREEE